MLVRQSFLCASIAIACAESACAVALRFENPPPGEPGHFAWTLGEEDDPSVWLDFTRPAHAQRFAQGPSGMAQIFTHDQGCCEFTCSCIIEYDASRSGQGASIGSMDTGFILPGTVAFEEGAMIMPVGIIWHHHVYHARLVSESCCETGLLTDIPVERLVYLAVRNDLQQHGWIAVTRAPGSFELTAHAWGYETEPDVSIEAGAGIAPDAAIADLDGDKQVGFADLLLMLDAWGFCPKAPPCPADLDFNQIVDFHDLLILLAVWGEYP